MPIIKTPADSFFALTPEQRRTIHFALCEFALQKWNAYISTRTHIKYIDSVVGTQQEVDLQLPVEAFESARQGIDCRNIAHRYLEPITALQDDDLTFPSHITFAYYALYNLFKKYTQTEAIDDWLIVNQALASEEDNTAWDALLRDAIQRAI
jgi:hypothetical protein